MATLKKLSKYRYLELEDVQVDDVWFTSDKSMLSVANPNPSGIAYGALYWQYIEKYEKITASASGLKISKRLYLKTNTREGRQLIAIDKDTTLNVGDLLTVRMQLNVDRDYEFIHLRDQRASTFEPVSSISGCRYHNGLCYYEDIKGAATNFFISCLRKGTYVLDYDLRVTHSGTFSAGIATLQCMYAPEFNAHSGGTAMIKCKNK